MSNYNHREAFCLMEYCCEECTHVEIIWNSRDGVAPSGTTCPSCGASMIHKNMWKDVVAIGHKLHKFQKFWRDGKDEEKRPMLDVKMENE